MCDFLVKIVHPDQGNSRVSTVQASTKWCRIWVQSVRKSTQKNIEWAHKHQKVHWLSSKFAQNQNQLTTAPTRVQFRIMKKWTKSACVNSMMEFETGCVYSDDNADLEEGGIWLNGGSGLREQFNWGEEMTTAMIIWTQSKQLLTILLWEEKFFFRSPITWWHWS